jgi:hypothetical protein
MNDPLSCLDLRARVGRHHRDGLVAVNGGEVIHEIVTRSSHNRGCRCATVTC